MRYLGPMIAVCCFVLATSAVSNTANGQSVAPKKGNELKPPVDVTDLLPKGNDKDYGETSNGLTKKYASVEVCVVGEFHVMSLSDSKGLGGKLCWVQTSNGAIVHVVARGLSLTPEIGSFKDLSTKYKGKKIYLTGTFIPFRNDGTVERLTIYKATVSKSAPGK